MKPRHKRLILVLVALALLGLGATFVLKAFRSNLVFFYTPTEVFAGQVPQGQAFRIGGMVLEDSLQRNEDGVTVRFAVTDTMENVPVQYTGILPDLFQEGKGVVAQGRMDKQGIFVADQVLAKHDENYMPPEAAEALERARKIKMEAE
ncbi:MAG: cytochrome c maturation protein CcmE [Betaproteobacteria bacterium]|jgi:cytochrome c-type biogenesis protein CcmE|nr:cytochrome c maturation protein CcmE [Burkholderiales bacterium]MBT5950252.1 cytochrome c maturation protein CcmE [Betaproteobacteria bacterium]MDA0359449.1 cytochrome c maturation protein CcmE [Pseudomonadota bacterium]MBL6878549.1 cytochrome c maturation protein CcmE [Burkholderiales bacterium]MBT6410905.1 cytochrome c maturation protein CcmE [Betaproteobacteria bacterium]